LIYTASSGCIAADGNSAELGGVFEGDRWVPSTTSVLKAVWPPSSFNFTCARNFEWHVKAGYLA
jgi:hypothetical protein